MQNSNGNTIFNTGSLNNLGVVKFFEFSENN